ncbi:MAG: GH39 family glycosyl hydrolase [Chloroflexia bacterium]
MLLLLTPIAGKDTEAEGGGHYYSATGKTLAVEFTAFYDSHGGPEAFGYPIDVAHTEGGYLVQYCERERLEYHPEHAGTPFEVLLGRLGADLTQGRADAAFSPTRASSRSQASSVFVPETGHHLGGPFLDYWRVHGGLTLFGYPISEEFVENGLRVQWFERARFEFHPELPANFRVSLGLLGDETMVERTLPASEVSVAVGPAAARHLQLGLSQGGESSDPAFFQNVVPLIGALHIPIIRLDNIYTFYHVVSRNTDGSLRYDWSALDPVVDSIRAMGAEPMLCLSYTPPTMSPDGTPIQPPTSLVEWKQLVGATVRHFNVDRNLGIRYWEVWNEPDQWSFWRGSWPDYLTLYDATRDALRAVDPQARVGGPARGYYDAGGLEWFLDHQQQRGAPGGAEFLSWHAYGLSPQTVADQIGTSRNLIAAHPGLHPEMAITEFNVMTGGPNDTSLGHTSDSSTGAAYVLAMLDRMDRSGLDRAFLFEVKDGYSADGAYWGRWGITTNDGHTKPIYHAIRAYQDLAGSQLPVASTGAAGVGALAGLPGGKPEAVLWNSSGDRARIHLALPGAWAGAVYGATLFDSTHNNPQATGDDNLTPYGTYSGSSLSFDLEPGSVLLLAAQ